MSLPVEGSPRDGGGGGVLHRALHLRRTLLNQRGVPMLTVRGVASRAAKEDRVNHQTTDQALPMPQELLDLYLEAARAFSPALRARRGSDASLPLLHLSQVGTHLTQHLPKVDMPDADKPGLAFALGALLSIWLVAQNRLNPQRFLALAGQPSAGSSLVVRPAGSPQQPFFGGLAAPTGLGAIRPGAGPRPANLGPLLRILRTGQAPPPPKPLGMV